VLRGPQGTLFGKNTTGGAVNIIAAKPVPEFASSLTLRAGEYGQRDVRGMLNFPVSDNVFIRVTAAKEQDDGYYYNRNLDISNDGGDLEAVKAALRLTPGDHWTIDTTFSVARQRDDNLGAQCSSGDGEAAWGGSRWYGDRDSVMYHAICDEDTSFGPFVNSSDKLTFSNVDQDGVFFTAEWDSAGPIAGLESLAAKIAASYRYITYDYLQDRDYSSLRIDAIGTLGGGDGATNRTRNGEFILQGLVSDRLDFVAGINYFEEEALSAGKNRCYALWVNNYDFELDNDVECLPKAGTFFELVPDKVEVRGRHFTAGPPTFFKNGGVWNESLGIFGHLRYRLNDDWELDVGARYTEDRREFSNIEFHISNYQRTNDLGLGSVDLIMNRETVIDNGFFNTGADTFSEVTPMISFTRHLAGGEPLDSGMFYLLYAEGFLTGGFNNELNTSPSNPTADLLKPFLSYGPEHLHNYEVGFKGEFANDRVSLNSSIYFMDYEDIHAFFVLDNSEGQLGASDAGINLTRNIAEVEIYGVEMELRAQPWSGGFLSFDIGFNHFGTIPYRTFDGDALAEGVLQFVEFGGDSEDVWTLNASLRHRFTLPNGASLTPMLGLYYDYYDETPSPPDAPADTAEFCDPWDEPFTEWRARLTYEPPNSDFQISLFGKNVTNERVYKWCARRRGAYIYRYGRPVSWGVEFSARWGG